MTELYWETRVGTSPDQKAVATSIVPHDGQLVVLFKGKTSDGEAYEGGVRLPLSTSLSPAIGTCTAESGDAPFQLIGSFQDLEFTQYEGIRSEGNDYAATFSFETKA